MWQEQRLGRLTCMEQNTERVGRSGQSQRQCRPQHPFHSDDGMWMEPNTAPPSQACLTSKNIPQKRTYSFLVHTDGAFSKKAMLGHGTAAN